MLDLANMPPSRQPVGSYPYRVQQPPQPLFPGNRPVSPRENYLRVLRGETPFWMPIWGHDTQYCWPDCYAEHALFETDGLDWWGQEWVHVPQVGGQVTKPGSKVLTDISNWRQQLTFPDLNAVNWRDDAAIQTARYDPDRAHLFHCVAGIFERLHELSSFEDAFEAMMLEPDSVHDFFDALVPYKIDILDKVFSFYAPIDYIIYGDDWGTQRAGFFSNSMFREFILPYTKRIWDWVHSQGKFVEIHSCGLTQQYIEEFLEMGADAWTPQQINDLDFLTDKYGDRISLTVFIKDLPSCNSIQDARLLVRNFVQKYAPRGGRVVAAGLHHPDPDILRAAYEELYFSSSEFYAKIR